MRWRQSLNLELAGNRIDTDNLNGKNSTFRWPMKKGASITSTKFGRTKSKKYKSTVTSMSIRRGLKRHTYGRYVVDIHILVTNRFPHIEPA